MKTPRPYQLQGIQEVARDYANNGRRPVIVMPTGSGKTVVGTELPQAIQLQPHERFFWYVHRGELAEQAANAFSERWPDKVIGIEMANQRASSDAQIVIASIPSLKGKRLNSIDPGPIKGHCIDEAHHAVATSYMTALQHMRALKGKDPDPHRWCGGFTATPNRHDNVGLNAVYDRVIEPLTLSDAIDQGWLVDIHQVRVETKIDISDVDKRLGEYVISQLEKRVNTPGRNNLAVRQYLDVSAGGAWQGLAACANQKHAEDLAEAFRQARVPVAALTDKTKKGDRKKILKAYESGVLRMITSCGILSEGIDLPRAMIAIVACPMLSPVRYRQFIGRVTRPYPAPEKVTELRATGHRVARKRRCIVVDLVDTSRHDVHTAPVLFGLSPKFNGRGESILSASREVKRIQQREEIPMRDITDLGEVELIVQRHRLLDVPQVPEEMRALSEFRWLDDFGRGYRLSLPDVTLTIEADTLGRCTISSVNRGNRREIGQADTLQQAVDLAERYIPAKSRQMGSARAKWLEKKPSKKQVPYLWKLDNMAGKKFHTAFKDDYEMFAESVMTRMTRGAVSAAIDKLKKELGYAK